MFLAKEHKLVWLNQTKEGNERGGGGGEECLTKVRTQYDDPVPLHLCPRLNSNKMHAPYEKQSQRVIFIFLYTFDFTS